VPAGTIFLATTPNGTQLPFCADVATHCEPLRLRMTSAPADTTIPLMLIFDTPLPVGQPIRFAFGLLGGRSSAQERARIAAEPGLSVTAHHSVTLVWEVSMPNGVWLALDPAQDLGRVPALLENEVA
jgi:hypothetical protein